MQKRLPGEEYWNTGRCFIGLWDQMSQKSSTHSKKNMKVRKKTAISSGMPFVESQEIPMFSLIVPPPDASSSTGGVPQKAPLEGSKCSQAGSASPEPSAALRTSEAPVETPMLGSTMPGIWGKCRGIICFLTGVYNIL